MEILTKRLKMADYGDFLDNEEVMDALFAILTGSKAPKDIEKRLNQNGNTIRGKLSFLRKNGVIIKDKWSYKADDKGIYNSMIKAVSEVLEQYERIAKNLDKPDKDIKRIRGKPAGYFPRDVMLATVTLYAKAFFLGYDAASFKDIVKAFLSRLAGSGSAKLIRDYPTLKAVKNAIRDVPAVL